MPVLQSTSEERERTAEAVRSRYCSDVQIVCVAISFFEFLSLKFHVFEFLSLKFNEGLKNVSVGVLVGKKRRKAKSGARQREEILSLVILLDMVVV